MVKEVVKAWGKREWMDLDLMVWGKDMIKGKMRGLRPEKEAEAVFWEKEVELNDL